MLSTSLANSAYAAATTSVRTDRGTEYQAFQAITAQLNASRRPDAPFAARAEAIHKNRRLWTILACDLADADNALPQELRAQLFRLSEFALLQSSKALKDADAIPILIDINVSVMRGLQDMGSGS